MELANLNTKYLARKFEYYELIDSTQDAIWRKIKNNQIENGETIFSEIQTNSYGTHGRNWYTDEKGDIAFSFAIKTDCKIENLDGITYEIAQIFKTIFRKNKIEITIKLPNDLYLNNKKMGGILCQTKIEGEKVKYLVIGIGININKKNFPEDIKNIATSINKEISNSNINRFEIISEFFNIFEEKLNIRFEK